jgi:hypothetical protein
MGVYGLLETIFSFATMMPSLRRRGRRRRLRTRSMARTRAKLALMQQSLVVVQQ